MRHVATTPFFVAFVGMLTWARICDHHTDGLITEASRIWELGIWQAPGWTRHTCDVIADTTLTCRKHTDCL